MPDLPDARFGHLIRRIALASGKVHPWNANHDTLDFYHGPVPANAPFEIELNWVSEIRGHTVRVGLYRVYPRALIAAGYCTDEGKNARVRFARRADGVVVLQASASAPYIEIGEAHFE